MNTDPNHGLKTKNPFPERRLYKFQDEQTGLFWNGNLKPNGVFFNDTGIEYRSLKVAEEAFRAYEFMRLSVAATWGEQPFAVPPVLVMVIYQVELIETDRCSFHAEPKDMRLTAFGSEFGKSHHLTAFVRLLAESKEFMNFQFIVERKVNTAQFVTEGLDRPVVSSRKTSKRFIALRTDADLLYLKMALGEAFQVAYDIQTARPL